MHHTPEYIAAIRRTLPVFLTNVGHGHAWPRPDGSRMRCTPSRCKSCSDDRAALEAAERAIFFRPATCTDHSAAIHPDILAAIESEMAYQVLMTADPERPDMIPNLSAGDIILAMEHCLLEARCVWYSDNMPHHSAAGFVRKVTALGIRFMETTCAPLRVIP